MKIKVESFDVRIVINALREMRNKLIEENEDTEYVDDTLLKYINILEKMADIEIVQILCGHCMNKRIFVCCRHFAPINNKILIV